MWRRIWVPHRRVAGAALVMCVGIGCAGLSVQFTAVMLGVRPSMLGLLAAVGGVAHAGVCLISGPVADRLGPRQTTRLATVSWMGVWLAMAMAGRIGVLLSLAVAGGVIGAFFWPSMMVWLAGLISKQPRDLGRAISQFNISALTGVVVGIVVAGALWDWVAQDSFYGSVAIGAVVLILLQITPSGGRQGRQHTTEEPTSLHYPALGRRLRITGRIGAFAGCFSLGTIGALFPKVGDVLGYSSVLVGWGAGAPLLGGIVIYVLAMTTSRWYYRSWKLWVAVPLGITGMVLAARASQPWQFFVGFVLLGLCTGICWLTSEFYSLHQREDRRSTSVRYNEATSAAGSVTGSLLGGLVADYTGWLPAAFALGAGVMVIAGLVQIVLWWVMSKADEASAA